MQEDVLQKLEDIRTEALAKIANAGSCKELQNIKVEYLGKKGGVTVVLKSIGNLSADLRPKVGQLANQVKVAIEDGIRAVGSKVDTIEHERKLSASRIDITLPGRKPQVGRLHPLTQVMREACQIFCDMGFSIHEGPEIETEYYNFDALNTPKEHPARDMHDTFYVGKEKLLRTHTSPVQIHVMETHKPPIFSIFPGTVYRRDYDISHTPMFHQIEGLMVDERITFGDLKGVLSNFCRKIFGEKTGVRFRPSFFPFTEPSAEVDIECSMCKGKGCRYCSQTGWVELLGCGMVDPKVFKSVNYDSKKVTGFAFGVGVDRIATLKYRINDSRLLYENDVRFLKQF
ncbi:phenylalanine--tRNA ligase subunit alpha [bacterium]|nr:phenylalanine--tRNA ligase subunit alpha [bacterium]